MSTYAEVELTVVVTLDQPWSDDESARVVRSRAKTQATNDLTRALVETNITVNKVTIVSIHSTTE